MWNAWAYTWRQKQRSTVESYISRTGECLDSWNVSLSHCNTITLCIAKYLGVLVWGIRKDLDAVCSHYLRATTIQGLLLFEGGYYSRVVTIWEWLILEGGYYLRVATGYYSRVATNQEWLILEGGYYLRVASIWGRLLFEGSYYLRVATIWGRRFFRWESGR